jgi:hypothetical protein
MRRKDPTGRGVGDVWKCLRRVDVASDQLIKHTGKASQCGILKRVAA